MGANRSGRKETVRILIGMTLIDLLSEYEGWEFLVGEFHELEKILSKESQTIVLFTESQKALRDFLPRFEIR